jgi:hypothetical protein
MQTGIKRRAAGFFACSMAFASLAFADNLKPIHIPPGDLVAALETLARQSGTEIVYISSQVGTQHTRGVSGTLSARAALETLLKGTAFKVTVDSSGAMLITLPSQGSATEVLSEASYGKTSATAPGGPPAALHLAQLQAPPAGTVHDSAGVKDLPADSVPEKRESLLDEVVVTG